MHRFLTLILLTLLTTTARAAQTEENWYVIEIQDQRSGWMREYSTTTNDNITTGMEMHIEFGRGNMKASVGIDSTFIETPDGKPVEMSMTQRLGTIPSSTRFIFHDDSVEMISTNAEQTYNQTMPRPAGDWLTPSQADAYTRKRLAAGDKEFSIRLLSPLTGIVPMDTTMRIIGEENIDVFGRTVPALRATVTTSLLPGVESTEYIDHAGKPLRTEQSFGAMKMVVLAADKQLALSKLNPPEMMASTFVKPTGTPITNPRKAKSAEYKLTAKSGPLPSAYTGGAQTAEVKNNAVYVRTDLSTKDTSAAGGEYLASTTMLAADDPVVRQLAQQATAAVPETTIDHALAMRDFVYKFVSEKSLGVGYASASEVARSRTGDCTEHAVLLAAMLRAQKIPSRVMSGLVYTQAFAGAEDVFGYHAWTQAHVDGRWIDLDPTLPPNRDGRPFDAAHIALGASAMKDGDLVNALVDVAPALGTLKIEVVEIK